MFLSWLRILYMLNHGFFHNEIETNLPLQALSELHQDRDHDSSQERGYRAKNMTGGPAIISIIILRCYSNNA